MLWELELRSARGVGNFSQKQVAERVLGGCSCRSTSRKGEAGLELLLAFVSHKENQSSRREGVDRSRRSLEMLFEGHHA